MLPRTLISNPEPATSAAPRAILDPSRAGSDEHVLAGGILLEKEIARRKPYQAAVSIVLHLAVLGAILMAPMFFARQMAFAREQVTFLATPKLPAAPAPLAALHPAVKDNFSLAKLSAPVAAPKFSAPSHIGESAVAPDLAAVDGGVPGGVLGGILGGTGSVGNLAAPGAVGTLHIGGQVQRPQVVYNPSPEYPAKAKKQKVQGDVQIDAIVDKDGNVIEAHALSGPALLIDAALKAVSQWKYEPTYLNGSPYPVELNVQISFHLGGKA
jgi:protein TonB